MTLALTAAAVIGVSIPAQAASNAGGCTRASEVCRITLNATNPTVTVSTGFAGVSSSARYSVDKGIYGASICSGSIGFNSSKSCSLGSYRGQVTFTFYKGQNTVGNIAIKN
jgi:hypothetical protein